MSDVNFHDPEELIFVQSRASVDEALVDEYAGMMADGTDFDPVEAIEDIEEEGRIYVWDGYHRGRAAMQAGKLLAVKARPGTYQEATWLALSANTKHGLRRSRADKQKVVYEALGHPKGVKMSDREIARHCGVSHPTVGQIRKDMEASGKIYQIETRIVTRGGQTYEQKTDNIGANQINYVEMWRLEQGLREWLAEEDTSTKENIDLLQLIKDGDAIGRDLMDMLLTTDTLPGPRRKRDVIQAVNNVLEQLRQQTAGEPGGRGAEDSGIRRVEVLPGEVCCLCGENLGGSGWVSEEIPGRYTCEDHQGMTQADYWAAEEGAKRELRYCRFCGFQFPLERLAIEECASVKCPQCKKKAPADLWLTRLPSQEVPLPEMEETGMTGPKPLHCPRCRLKHGYKSIVKKQPGGGLHCISPACEAEWPSLRALREEKTLTPAVFEGERERSGDEKTLRRLEIVRFFAAIVDEIPEENLDSLEKIVNDLAKFVEKERV